MTPAQLAALAAAFYEAEATEVSRARRAVARHLALSPETPDAIGILRDQLELSAIMNSLEVVFGLGSHTAYAARAAVLDMGLVIGVESMSSEGAEALAAPWVAASSAPA